MEMQTILITGASSGIGAASAKVLAERGHSLILAARRKDRLEGLVKEIEGRTKVRPKTLELDVQDREKIQHLARDGMFKDVTVLINNAGLARGLDTIQEGKYQDWNAMIDTNLKGLLWMSEAVLPSLIQNSKNGKSTHIVNVGSVAGHWTYPKGNIYSATKHAVKALSESFRLDLLGTGVRVTEISPGMVETEFSEVRLGDTQKAKSVYQGMTPLLAQDIAEAIDWCIHRPKHVNIQEVIIYPTDQASPTNVFRRT